jgi:hypothetical protein
MEEDPKAKVQIIWTVPPLGVALVSQAPTVSLPIDPPMVADL